MHPTLRTLVLICILHSPSLAQCEQQEVSATDGAQGDNFAACVDLRGDLLVIGAPGDDDAGQNAGAVYVFRWGPYAWSLEQKIVAPGGPVAGGAFGWTVATSGDTIVVGSSPQSYVFERTVDGEWSLRQTLSSPHPGANAEAVAIDGDTIAIADDQYVTTYVRVGGTWVEESFTDFGGGVGGGIYRFGLALQGDRIVHGNHAAGGAVPGAGSVRVLGRIGVYPVSSWVVEAVLAEQEGEADDDYGWAVDIDGASVVVGAPGRNEVGNDSGAVYVYRLVAGSWGLDGKLIPDDPQPSSYFGTAVALESDHLLAGCHQAIVGGVLTGATYHFMGHAGAWSEQAKFAAQDSASDDHFGISVDLNQGLAVVGSSLGPPTISQGDATTFVIVSSDCDGDGITDAEAIASGLAVDCNSNCIPDACDALVMDCNGNGDPDDCDPDLDGDGAPDDCVQITSVSGVLSSEPGPMVIEGKAFEPGTVVLVDRHPVPILTQTPTQLQVTASPGDPGTFDLEVANTVSTAFLEGGASLWPTLAATTSGVGGSVDVVLDNGDAGLYALAFATGLLSSPFPIASPPTWYGVLLDSMGPVFTTATGAFATADPVLISLPVPNNPGLAGLTLYFQAWCQQGFFGPDVTASFTNAEEVTL